MEDLVGRARAAEAQVSDILKKPDEPIQRVLSAYVDYRAACMQILLADYEIFEREEGRLWFAHTEGRKYFHGVLSRWRRSEGNANRPVETRVLTKLYKQYLKQSTRFYTDLIYRLHIAVGGIPELEDMAQKARKDDGVSESSAVTIPATLRQQVLLSCHRSLVYLGDLWRYRASERLDDKGSDYGPAVGYYGLAASLIPTSGLGHHQQAVVALAQNHHLRAIYHLYRSVVATDPHPAAANNLRLEFEKTNVAWTKGELIRKGAPNDPDAPKHALVGWFVGLHSMCYKGDSFRGYDELEREVLTQLVKVMKQRDLEGTLLRMALVNIAAQHYATDRFRQNSSNQNLHTAFLYYFRFNLRMFTAILSTFHDDLRAKLVELNDNDAEMPEKLTPLICQLLPAIRLYSSWLLTHPIVQMTYILLTDAVVQEAIRVFWPMYARTIDLVAQAFPIWDLDDLPELTYLFSEDVDTLAFQPLEDEKTLSIWRNTETGAQKIRFCDRNVVRHAPDEEVLHKLRTFLANGAYLATDRDDAPIKLVKARFFVGEEAAIEPLAVAPTVYQPEPTAPSVQQANAKPLSYANAAAKGNARRGVAKPNGAPATTTYSHSQSQEAQLNRMVDALLDEEPEMPTSASKSDGLHADRSEATVAQDRTHRSGRPSPETAPSKQVNGEMHDSLHDFTSTAELSRASNSPGRSKVTTPIARPPRSSATNLPSRNLQQIWDNPQRASTSSNRPTSSRNSPGVGHARGHARLNSANSDRGQGSPSGAFGDGPWRKRDSASRISSELLSSSSLLPSSVVDQNSAATSPLLFGAPGSLWSSTSPAPGHTSFGANAPVKDYGG